MKYVIVILAYVVTGIESALLNKEEGDKCKFVGVEEWVCQTLTNCPHVDVKIRRPDICSFRGKQPIICCPPKPNLQLEFPIKIGEVVSIDGSSKKPPNTSNKPPGISGSGTSTKPTVSLSNGTSKKPPTSSSSASPNTPSLAVMKCIEYDVKLCHKLTENKDIKKTRFIRDASLLKEINFRHVASAYQFPFMAAIGFGEEPGIIWECGGTVVSETWVLSAAHCAQSSFGKAKWVGVASSEMYPEFLGIRIPIKQIVVHPSYKAPAMNHDIALFQHEFNLAFNHYLRPVCLYPLKLLPRYSTATSWGTNTLNGEINSNLVFNDMKTVDPQTCLNFYDKSTLFPRDYDNEIMFCATEAERNTCISDSGGPLFYSSSTCLYIQIGVVSFGRNCSDYPKVYTRISHYLPWIESTIWPNTKLDLPLTPESFFS